MKKLIALAFALVLCISCMALPTFAASKADNRQIGYTAQTLKKGSDTPEVVDQNIDVNAVIPLGVAISYSNLNGDQSNIGVGSYSARTRAMNDSMGKADLYALLNPLRVGVATAVRI